MNALLDRTSAVLGRWGVSASRGPARTEDSLTDLVLMLDAGARGARSFPTVIKLGPLDGPRATAMPLPPDRPLLVLAPFVPDAAAHALKARDVQFVDGEGNLGLAWEGMSVDARGHRPATPPRRDPSASRALTRSGAMVVFTLLSWPEMVAHPVREIAAASGAAVGTAHAVLGALSEAGYVYDSGGRAGLNRAGELLDRWAEAYTVRLARHLDLGSYSLAEPDRLGELETSLVDAGALIGGELAGARIDAHLRPTTATFYVDEVPGALAARFRLRRDDNRGAIHFRRRFWHRTDAHADLVPSPLVYADLLASGDPRQREHAERIRRVDDRLVELDRS